jgi:hypothetical protein
MGDYEWGNTPCVSKGGSDGVLKGGGLSFNGNG